MWSYWVFHLLSTAGSVGGRTASDENLMQRKWSLDKRRSIYRLAIQPELTLTFLIIDIFITHLIIIITSEVSTFSIIAIFFRSWASVMVLLSCSVIYNKYILGTMRPCFHYWCSVYDICKWSDTLWPVVRVRLFADYTISLSSLCRLIWRHWIT